MPDARRYAGNIGIDDAPNGPKPNMFLAAALHAYCLVRVKPWIVRGEPVAAADTDGPLVGVHTTAYAVMGDAFAAAAPNETLSVPALAPLTADAFPGAPGAPTRTKPPLFGPSPTALCALTAHR